MKAINFKGCNLTLAENQPQYQPLPVCYQGGGEAAMTSCMKLTLKERIKLLFTGKLFITQLTFNTGFHPQRIELDWEEPTCINCGHGMGQHRKPNFFCPPKLN